MRKTYMKPLIEVQDIEMEAPLCVSGGDGITSTNLDDVTHGDNKPTSFSKGHNSLWDFEEEE